MKTDIPTSAPAPASPATEAFAVRIGYIWLMALAPVAGLVICLLSAFAEGSALGFLLGLALLPVGYWAWRRGYRAVRLVLAPEHLRVLPVAPGQPAQDIPLSSIAGYLRPQESYYQILCLMLHGGGELNISKRLRTPPAGTLAFDDWATVLASRLEQARPAAAAAEAPTPAPASGLVPGAARVFARTAFGKILAGLAALGGAHLGVGMLMAPVLYLGYYFRARGALKVTTYAYTGANTTRYRALQDDLDDTRRRTLDDLGRLS